MKTIHVPSDCTHNRAITLPTIRLEGLDKRLVLLSVEPKTRWDNDTGTFLCSSDSFFTDGMQAMFHFRDEGSGFHFDVLIGFHSEEFDEKKIPIYTPWCRSIPLGVQKNSQSRLGDSTARGKSTSTPSSAREFRICHDSIRLGKMGAQESVADLSLRLSNLVKAAIKTIKFLERQEVILQVQLLK
jgi:hypothetical protein